MKIITFILKILQYLFYFFKPKKSVIMYNQFYISNYEEISFDYLKSKMNSGLSRQNNYRINITAMDDRYIYLIRDKINYFNKEDIFIEKHAINQYDTMQLNEDFINEQILISIDDTAEKLHMTSKKFIYYLLKNRFIYQDLKHRFIPYQKYIINGIFKLKKIRLSTNESFDFEILVTSKGVKLFSMQLNSLYF